jgi:hypothetical protein
MIERNVLTNGLLVPVGQYTNTCRPQYSCLDTCGPLMASGGLHAGIHPHIPRYMVASLIPPNHGGLHNTAN